LPLCTDVLELTWPQLLQSVKDCWNDRLQIHHAIRPGTNEQYTEGKCWQVLLELDTPVHCKQGIVRAAHAPKKLAVRDASPTPADHSIDTVAFKRRSKI
jgi:hypothetical protein